MKKELLSLFLIFSLILFLIPVISAPEIILSKESYQPRETLQAEITGNFLSLIAENIQIFEGDKVHSEPVIKDLMKRDNKYYFYALLPNKESNFSLRIVNTEYIESGELKENSIIKNFSIIKTNQSSLSINPGFIVTKNAFSIGIKALNKNQDITATLTESGETNNFSLIEETEKTILFQVSNLTSVKNNLKINDYSIPVFFILKKDNASAEEKGILEFVPASLSGVIIANRDYLFKIFLKNSGDKNITNINLTSDFNAKINPDKIDFLQAGNNTIIEITILQPAEKISGNIFAEFSSQIINIPVSFEITDDVSEVNINESGVVQTLSCQGMGLVCSENQECNGEIVSSLEGACCKAQCIEKTAASDNYRWVAGILLLIVLLIIIALFIMRLRKKRRLNSYKDALDLRSKRYMQRLSPSDEVSGKLDRI